MDGGRGDAEEAPHVGFGGRAGIDAGIGVDEGQILPLLGRETRFGWAVTSQRSSGCRGFERRGDPDDCTLSRGPERSRAHELQALTGGGRQAVRKVKRAQILLAADAGHSDEAIAATVAVGTATVHRTRRRFVEGNLDEALGERPRPGASRKLSGKEEALLVATACSEPPEGRARWTLDLLAGALVRLTEHDDVSRETVRRRLAENDLKPWRRDMWCIPHVDAEYVARMEDVLDLYAEDARPGATRWCASTRARPS